ncbi:uncharacterized protein ACR2FA_010050 [Aphomia sociella]
MKDAVDITSICWECNAILRRIASFRNKAWKAQSIIKGILERRLDNPPKHSLSDLLRTNTELVSFDINSINNLKPEFEGQDEAEIESGPCVEELNFKIEDNEEFEAPIDEVKDECDDVHDEEGKVNIIKPNVRQTKDNHMYTIRILSEEEMFNEREGRKNSSRFHKCTLKCEKCIEIYSNKKCLDYHLRKHDKMAGKFLCNICEQRFTLDSELKNHNLMHYRSYKCRVCEMEFHNEDLVVKHHRDNHNEDGYACDVCQDTFLTKKMCQLHRRSKHKSSKCCPLCNKRLGHNTDMKKHMLTHTSVSFECDICHKKYRSESGMRTHRRTHSEQKNEAAYCAECGVQFKSTYTYRAHLQTSLKHVSVEDLKHKCPHCEKRWATAAYLKYHIESIHTKEMNYICKICEQAFNSSRRLRAHVRLKHEGKPIPKNKICNICSKAFTTKVGLQEHINSHTGARPYICSVCDATFSHSGALYTHVKLLHKKQRRRKPDRNSPDRYGLGES